MKQKTKNVINTFCYIGIFILLTIIILPVVLRFLLPDKDEYTNEISLQLLTCTKIDSNTHTKKTINTHYKNNVVEIVNIKYTNVTDETYIEEKDYYNYSGVEVNEENSVITINITPTGYNKNRLKPLFNSINKQKSIYEDGDYNYTCTITKDS